MVGVVSIQSIPGSFTDIYDEKHMVVHFQGQGKVQKGPTGSLQTHSGANACDLI